jgi:hypothetical protein
MRWVGHAARRGEMNAYEILVGKPEEKRPLGKPTRRWNDVRIDHLEIGWEGVDCTHLVQDSKAENFLTI